MWAKRDKEEEFSSFQSHFHGPFVFCASQFPSKSQLSQSRPTTPATPKRHRFSFASRLTPLLLPLGPFSPIMALPCDIIPTAPTSSIHPNTAFPLKCTHSECQGTEEGRRAIPAQLGANNPPRAQDWGQKGEGTEWNGKSPRKSRKGSFWRGKKAFKTSNRRRGGGGICEGDERGKRRLTGSRIGGKGKKWGGMKWGKSLTNSAHIPATHIGPKGWRNIDLQNSHFYSFG
jgi:hypothetical protein